MSWLFGALLWLCETLPNLNGSGFEMTTFKDSPTVSIMRVCAQSGVVASRTTDPFDPDTIQVRTACHLSY
jgi:hypothetical protein